MQRAPFQSGHSSTHMQQQPQSNPQKNVKKQSQQFKALFLKNLRLQSKQKGTNLCQILTPILCIIFTYLIKQVVQQNIKSGAMFEPLLYPVKFDNFTQFDQLNRLKSRNKLQWLYYTCGQDCDHQLLGMNDGSGNRSGILGNIPPSYDQTVLFHPDPTNLNYTLNMYVPFFLQLNNSIDETIYDKLQFLGQQNFTLMKKYGGFDSLPDGVYNISNLNSTYILADIKVNDLRELQFHRVNGISQIGFDRLTLQGGYPYYDAKFDPDVGILLVQDWLTQAFIKQATNKTVQSGVFLMPQDESGISFIDTLINIIAILIFPISLSLLFPVFLYSVVLQKQQKLIQMMKMNGMKISSYWFVYFIFNLILSAITNFVFFIMGSFMTKMRFFTQTDPLLLIVVLLGWSLAQIGMAVFFQTFLNKSRSANIIGYLISIWTSMIGSTLCIGVYQYPNQLPIGARFFAPFGFTRIMYLLLSGCSEGRCYGNIGNIPTEMKHEIVLLYANFLFFFLLGTYLFQIIPQQFGVTRSAFFPFGMIKRFVKNKINKNNDFSETQIEQDLELKTYIQKNDEDNFSKKQRNDLLHCDNVTTQNPLVINNLRKLYYKEGLKKMYAAVKSFNLKVGPKQTFGLLGPNGAGKTTLISMITGMFEPNYGNAWIGGYDIRTSIEKAQLQMGVCPQFDLLWPQLTVSEHLYFYGRLKGIPSSQIKQKVNKAIQQVKLTKFKDFPSSSLSGGMKRRLSVAISLVGDPKIVFLDQPSTGLDPQNRRQLWQVLANCQKDRAIFITTHMMQQADTLCNRVGIITKGVLRTVAPQSTLKNVYGGGYRVSISICKQERKLVDRDSIHYMPREQMMQQQEQQQEQQDLKKSINSFIETQQNQKKQKSSRRVQKISKFMHANFPGSQLLKQYIGYLIFKVPSKYKVSDILQVMQKMQKQLEVADMAITNSSLQDVFMNVVKCHQRKQGEQQVQYENIDQKQSQVYKTFPINSNIPTNNINSTPLNSQLKKSVQSSVISKKRESVASKGHGLKGSQYEDQIPKKEQQEGMKPNEYHKSGDDDEDYY